MSRKYQPSPLAGGEAPIAEKPRGARQTGCVSTDSSLPAVRIFGFQRFKLVPTPECAPAAPVLESLSVLASLNKFD
jgi:hypothetical protein